MAMPKLDPARYPFVVLGDPTHRLPMPDRAGLFPKAGRRVDAQNPFWSLLLADRSLVRAAPPAAAAARPAAAKPEAAPSPSTSPASSSASSPSAPRLSKIN